jgi:hypothetical protein
MTVMVAMLSRRPLALAAPLSLLLGLASGPAFAQSDGDRATARELGRDGQAALDQKDYKTAEDKFRRADKLVHAPTLELGLARALAGEGKFMESQETYNRIIREGLPPGASDVFKQALDAAKQEVGAVSPRVAGATINVQADGGGDVPAVSVTLDGQPLNAASLGVRRQVDPGDHVVKATADGFLPGEARFNVGEGGSQTVQITLKKDLSAPPASAAPPATPPAGGVDTPPEGTPPKRSILPWIAFGVGGAGLLTGAITGGLALGQHSSISSDCGGGSSCPTTEQGKIDSFHTMALVSDIGFVVAGVGAAAGVVLLIVHPYDSAPAAPAAGFRVTPTVGFGSVGAIGTF